MSSPLSDEPALPDKAQFRRFQFRVALWAVIWVAIFPAAIYALDRYLSSHLGAWRGAHTILLIIALSFAMALAPSFGVLRLALGTHAGLPKRWRRMVAAEQRRRSRPLGKSVHEWTIFTRVLVIVFFGALSIVFALGSLLIFVDFKVPWGWIGLAFAALLAIPPAYVIREWFFRAKKAPFL